MLTSDEVERLRGAIIATIAAPIVGSIEDYSWEAIFHYVKNIPLSDPTSGRTKLLHDAVDVTWHSGCRSRYRVQLPQFLVASESLNQNLPNRALGHPRLL